MGGFMNRTALVAIFLFLVSAFTLAQNAPSPSQDTQASPPAHTHDHAQMHSEHPKPTQSMCQQMMQEHMSQMKSMSEALGKNLAQVKSTLPMIKDINERSRWQSNIAMWEALSDHFSQMAQHAGHMQSMGMGCGMMMEQHGMGMSHTMGMGKDESKPAEAETPPKQ
jgi:hypothetical protein